MTSIHGQVAAIFWRPPPPPPHEAACRTTSAVPWFGCDNTGMAPGPQFRVAGRGDHHLFFDQPAEIFHQVAQGRSPLLLCGLDACRGADALPDSWRPCELALSLPTTIVDG